MHPAERTARRFRLTDEGTLYYERCRRIITDVRDAEVEVSALGAAAPRSPQGRCADRACRRRIAPLLAELTARHRGLAAHLVPSDAGLEVGQDALDVSIIASVRRIVCAAPSYLTAHGMPERPADLAGHECLRLSRRHHLYDRWRFRTGSDVEEIKVGGHASSGSGDVRYGT